MQRSVLSTIAFLAFASFCFYCLRSHSPEIQRDISNRVAAVLQANQIPVEGLKVDGRDVVLSGLAGSREISDDARRLAAGVYGVRTVDVRELSEADAAPDAKTIAAKVDTQRKLDALLAQRVVEFDSQSARLTAQGSRVLNQVAPLLAAAPALFCEIQGHTDSQGTPSANLALSRKRALATMNYLISKGVAPERLLPKAFGDTQPVASNATEAGRKQNRRIAFVLKEKR